MRTFKPALLLLSLFFVVVRISAQDIDSELSKLAVNLAASIKEQGKKKITVLDFADLQGRTSELGRYIAEQLTVGLVLEKRDFAVLDRANLKSILAEHKLTAKGLIDPENAKKLGMFSGVDALILGTVIPKKQSIGLTARIITTDTAEVVAAAKAEFKRDETVQELLANATPEAASAGAPESDGPKIVKSFGDLRVELEPLQIVNGKDYRLTMNIANQSARKASWVALNMAVNNELASIITDANGNEFTASAHTATGITYLYSSDGTFQEATEIPPKGSIIATVKFPSGKRTLSPGRCNLQLELLVGSEFDGTSGKCTVHNLVTKIEAK